MIRSSGHDSSKAAIARVESAFDAARARLAPLAPGASLLLGCSAGGDSMALLRLAASRAEAAGWRLAVAHVDHRQRPESAEEAAWVAGQARELGVEAFVERLDDAPASGAQTGVASASGAPLSEDVMRQGRLRIFGRLARQWGATAVVLAHQADDRAETFLIRLLAGSGPTGLAGIRPVQRVAGLTLARPLLGARRADLRAWLRSRGAAWREDPTNADLGSKRSWARHALLPMIAERLGLDPTDRIARAAALLDDESQALAEAADLLLARLRRPAPPPARDRLDLADPLWLEASPRLRRQMLRQWLWRMRRAPHPPGLATVEQALGFAEKARPGAELRTIERMHLTRLRDGLLAFDPSVDAEGRAARAKMSDA
jgi:tRNA(Ile)-lysidine synthase